MQGHRWMFGGWEEESRASLKVQCASVARVFFSVTVTYYACR